MSLTDPIADMLTIIRNAKRARLEQADLKRSKMSVAILEVLKRERFVYDYKTIEDDKQGILRVYLKPPAGLGDRRVRRISSLQRVSRPGLRIYTTCARIPRVLNGLGFCVLSTSKGIMTGQDAKRHRLGGEVLLKVY